MQQLSAPLLTRFFYAFNNDRRLRGVLYIQVFHCSSNWNLLKIMNSVEVNINNMFNEKQLFSGKKINYWEGPHFTFSFFVCFFRILLNENSWILVITATQCISESCQVASMEWHLWGHCSKREIPSVNYQERSRRWCRGLWGTQISWRNLKNPWVKPFWLVFSIMLCLW